MSRETTSSKNATKEKTNINASGILKRPIVKLAILVVIIILAVVLLKGAFSGKTSNDTKLEGYQKLVDVTNNTYTFVDLDGKVKKYEGYTSMNDFYYDVTCASKPNENGGATQVALINKGNGTVVKFGTYDNIIQIIGGRYYKVQKDGKYGVIDYKGNVLIQPEYDYISITTVQEATELIFECQKDGVYYFITETGKTLMQTESALHSISYANKFNEEYNTIVYISVDGARRYFNIVTGEELFAGMDGVSISYNILKTDSTINFYDKAGKLKEQIDISGNYSTDTRVYFRKYIVLEQRTINEGNRSYKYTVYDSNFKTVLESDSRVIALQDIDENVYFIINESDGVRIINENKKEVKVKGYEYNGNSLSNLQYVVLNPTDDTSKYSVFNLKGKEVISDISEYSQRGFGLVISKYNENGNFVKSLVLGNGKEIALEERDEVVANENYITIENSLNSTITVVDREGNIKVDKVKGTKTFYVKDYIGIQSENSVTVYNVNTGKQTFTYDVSNYINRNETVNVIELKNGYFRFDGKTILEKTTEE